MASSSSWLKDVVLNHIIVCVILRNGRKDLGFNVDCDGDGTYDEKFVYLDDRLNLTTVQYLVVAAGAETDDGASSQPPNLHPSAPCRT